MPVKVRRQNCVMANGNRGQYVVFETSSGKKKSCHKTRNNASAAARIRNEAERQKRSYEDINDKLDKVIDKCNSLSSNDENEENSD